MPLTRPTTTPLPDEIYDVWAPVLGAAELKVLLYIVRRTLGFGKQADAISLGQFMHGIVTRDGHRLDHGCGITSRPNVVKALASLEEKGLIRATKERTRAGGRAVTTYALLWEESGALATPSPGSETTPGGSVATTPGWFRSESRVVLEQHQGSVATTPTTNSKTRNRQQNSGTKRACARARPPSEELAQGHALDSPEGIWQAVLGEVRPLMTTGNYERWLASTHALGREGNALQVAVVDDMHAFWLDTRLRRLLDDSLHRLGLTDLCIAPVVPE